jgi:hypothetical protein
MAKRKGGQSFSVSVTGLEALARIPGFLDRGQRILLERSTTRIAEEIAKRAPGGASSKAGRDVEARVLTSTTAVIRSKGFAGAKVLERGGFIRSKRGPGTAIKFQGDDGPVFVRYPRGVRIKARGYFRKGLRTRGKIVREAFAEGFHDLETHG